MNMGEGWVAGVAGAGEASAKWNKSLTSPAHPVTDRLFRPGLGLRSFQSPRRLASPGHPAAPAPRLNYPSVCRRTCP